MTLTINSQDLIVNSPLWLLHISLWTSYENLVLDEDYKNLPDEFEYSYHLFAG